MYQLREHTVHGNKDGITFFEKRKSVNFGPAEDCPCRTLSV